MKKLILAALAFFGLASPNLAKAADSQTIASPVTSLTDGGFYFIYDAHADDGSIEEVPGSNDYRYAFRRANADNNDIYGTHIKPFNAWNNGANDQLDNYHVWKAIATESGAWKFQNVGKNSYMGASAKMADDAQTFVLIETDSPTTFKVKVESNANRWDGNGNNANFPMSYYGGQGHPINFYEAISEGDGYKFATANGWNVTYTFPTYREGVTAYTKTVMMAEGSDASSQIPTLEFFTASSIEGNPIVSGDNKNFTVQGTWNLPILPNHVYRMRLRPAYLTGTNPQPQNCRFMHFSGTEADLAYTDIEETDFSTDFLWFFSPAGDITEDGLIPVTLHGMSMPANDGLEFEVTNLQPNNGKDIAVGFQSSNPTVWYLRSSNVATAGENDFMLEHSQVLPDYPDRRVYINHRNNKVATWLTSLTSARADDGCVFRAYEMLDSDWDAIADGDATEEQINNAKENPTVENVKAVVAQMSVSATDVQDIFDAADYFINDLGLASEADINEWKEWKNSVTDINKVNPTRYALLNSALSTLVYNSSIHMPAEGKHIRLRHAISEDEQYLGINGAALSANAEEGKDIFTLKPAENGAGFYLYNEYANKYVTFPATLSSEPSSVYILDMYSDLKNITFGIRTADGAGNIYISKNAANNNIAASAKTDAAQWTITTATAEQAAEERLNGEIARVPAVIAKGNALKAVNISSDAAVNAWDAAVTKFNSGNVTLEEAQAITTLCNALARDVKNVYATLSTPGRPNNPCMGAEPGAAVINANAPEGAARVMNLMPAENGAGFYLYSPNADLFIIHPSATQQVITTTKDKAQATIYAFDVLPDAEGNYADNKTVSFMSTTITEPGYDYLHANSGLNLVTWEKTDASSWIVSVCEVADVTINYNSHDGSQISTKTNLLFEGEVLPTPLGFTCDNGQPVSASSTSYTYTLNEGTPMQIYNERADSYVFVHENGLWQTKDENDEATNFLQVKADEEGGFVIYSPSAKKMVGNLAGANSVTPMVDVDKAQKYFTGKFDGSTVDGKYYPKYADWIGIVNDINNTQQKFFNDNANNQSQHPENLRYVCAYSRVDDGSKWVIVTHKENFKENWGMREDLIAAKAAYKAALEKVGTEPNQTLVDFVDNFYFGGDVNLPLSDETRENYQALLAAVDDAAETWGDVLMDGDKLFTIKSTEDIRGALIYDEENDCMSTTKYNNANITLDPTNDNHVWGFVKVGEKFYLYNLGAKKFANAYIFHDGASQTGAVYAWTVGNVPTALELSTEAFGAAEALSDNKFIIKGGKAGESNPAGMMIINGDTTPIPCALGNNNITDGTGFILTEVEGKTSIDDEMIAKVTAGFDSANDEIETICMPLEGEEFDADTHGKQVGHFTQEAVTALESSKAAAQAIEDKEEAMYAALEAVHTFKTTESNYRSVEDGNVYTIADSEGNIHYTDGTDHLTTDDASELKDVKYGYWVATVTDGKVTFSHTHEGPEETPAAARAMYYANTQVVNFAAGEATEFTVNRSAVLGRVTLNDDNSKSYVITHVSANANEATTEIAEITSASKAGEIYDLQGRRLAAPTHGVNIINGKKVLVK